MTAHTSRLNALTGYLTRASESRANAVPCNLGCGTWLESTDDARQARLDHYAVCEKASPLMRKAAALNKQNTPQAEKA